MGGAGSGSGSWGFVDVVEAAIEQACQDAYSTQVGR